MPGPPLNRGGKAAAAVGGREARLGRGGAAVRDGGRLPEGRAASAAVAYLGDHASG